MGIVRLIRTMSLSIVLFACTVCGAAAAQDYPTIEAMATPGPPPRPPQIRAPTAAELANIRALDEKIDRQRDDSIARMEAVYPRSLAIRAATYGPNHPLIPAYLSYVASCYMSVGQFNQARSLQEAALAVGLRGVGDSLFTARLYAELVRTLDYQREYALAEQRTRERIAMLGRLLGEDNLEVGLAWKDLGDIQSSDKRYDDAQIAFRKALEILNTHRGADDPETVGVREKLRLALFFTGRGEDAAALTGSLSKPRSRAVYTLTFDPVVEEKIYQDTVRLLEQIASVYGADSYYIGVAAQAIGQSLMNLRRYDEAETFYRLSFDTFVKTLDANHEYVSWSGSGLAKSLEAQFKASDAEPYRALALTDAIAKKSEYEIVSAYDALAENYRLQGRLDDALEASSLAIDLERRRRDRRALSGMTGLQGARLAQGQAEAGLRAAYANYVAMAFEKSPALDGLSGKAFLAAQDFTEAPAARALMRAQARAALGAGALGDLVNRQQILSDQVASLDRRLLAAQGRGDVEKSRALSAERDGAVKAFEDVITRIGAQFPAYALKVAPHAASLRKTRLALKSDQGLIFLLPTLNAVYTFALTRSGATWSKAPIGIDTLAGKVDTLLGQTGAPGRLVDAAAQAASGGFSTDIALDLYQMLIAPVERDLKGVRRLYVVADGPLEALPLSLLVTAPVGPQVQTLEGIAWFGDRYALTYLPSVSSLTDTAQGKLSRRKADPTRSSFIGYGAPLLGALALAENDLAEARQATSTSVTTGEPGRDLADPRWLRAHFKPLPGPARELTWMADKLGAPIDAVRLGGQATEAAIKADPLVTQAQILAFATHGFLAGEVPGVTEPGLVLTPPAMASSQDDGVLTASEVAALRLDADWVLLSACNTATGDGLGADDLASAFLYAGAGAVLASHWSVDDAATTALTTETISLRRAGMSRARALKAAMAAVRTGRRSDGGAIAEWSPLWRHPRYWAAFTVISNRDD